MNDQSLLNNDEWEIISEDPKDQEDSITQDVQSFVNEPGFNSDEWEVVDPQEKAPESPKKKTPRNIFQKSGRLITQTGLGALEKETFMYDIPASSLAQPQAQEVELRKNVMSEIERLLDMKQTGIWDEEDEKHLQNQVELIKNPKKLREFVQTVDITSQGLIEKATGLDLDPEGTLEKGARWLGFIKDPKKTFEAIKNLRNPNITKKEVFNVLKPGIDEARALGAGTALQIAEDNDFGPVGSLAAMVIGDASPFVLKSLFKTIKDPKKVAANITNLFSGNNSKTVWTKQLIKDAQKAGIQLDAGTISNSNLVKFAQARASQSSLTGTALDDFRKQLSEQIIDEYKKVADNVGVLRFESEHQASEALKDTLKTVEEKIKVPSIEQRKPIRIGEESPLKDRISVEEQVAKPEIESFLNEISPTEVTSDISGGKKLREVSQKSKEAKNKVFDKRFSEIKNETSNLSYQPKTLVDDITKFIEENKGSLLLGESTAEHKVVKAAIRLKRELTNTPILDEVKKFNESLTNKMLAYIDFGMEESEIGKNLRFMEKQEVAALEKKFKKNITQIIKDVVKEETEASIEHVSLKNMIQTKRTLSDVADWEFGGSKFAGKYKKLVGDANESIDNFLRNENTALYNKYKTLNSDYKNFKDIFENKNVIKLFEPKNKNYASIYNEFVKNPDKFKQLETLLLESGTKESERILKEVKRDFSKRVLEDSTLSPRETNNLIEILGENFRKPIEELNQSIKDQKQKKPPKIKQQKKLGLRIDIPKKSPLSKKLSVKETAEHKQRKLYEFLGNKSDAQILKELDTVKGIKRLGNVLNETEEGRKLFEDLKRFKLEKMITEKMKDSQTKQIKLGTFSKLSQKLEDKAILKELIGSENLNKIERLQRVSGALAESANKFFNTSQSGTAATDVALISAAVLSVITVNPWMIGKTVAAGVSFNVISRLLSNTEFLKHLEDAVLSKGVKKAKKIDYDKLLKRLEPIVLQEISNSNKE